MRHKLKLTSLLALSFLIISSCVKANGKSSEVKMEQEKITKRVGSLIKVRPEFEERYIILHRNAFPGVLKRINESNIRNYSIFLLDGMLFSYLEYVGNNYDADMKAIANPITKDWWKLTDPMQEPLPTRKPGEWWAVMDQVLCLDNSLKPYNKAQQVALVAQIADGKESDVVNYLKNFPSGLQELVNKYNLQNCNMFIKDGKLYFYYEYTGENLSGDMNELYQQEKFNLFNQGLQQFLVKQDDNYWQLMKEVFHTN